MADIELVIKIPEEVKNRLCLGVIYQEDLQAICEALNDGTPLPKEHGRLFDEDEILYNENSMYYDLYEIPQYLDTIPCVLEVEGD